MVLNDQYADGKVADFKNGDGVMALLCERDPPPTNERNGVSAQRCTDEPHRNQPRRSTSVTSLCVVGVWCNAAGC